MRERSRIVLMYESCKFAFTLVLVDAFGIEAAFLDQPDAELLKISFLIFACFVMTTLMMEGTYGGFQCDTACQPVDVLV